MTIGDAKRWVRKTLQVDNPRQEADWMLCALLQMNITQLLMAEKKPLPERDRSTLESWLSERATGKPLQYILGEWSFMGLTFAVREGVLIPREDSEPLVQAALVCIDEMASPDMTVLDLCTGSGAIAITLAKSGEAKAVDAVDISIDACALARDNAVQNEVEINVFCEDVLAETFWRMWQSAGKQYQIITANPPYISAEELLELDKGVRDYEPLLALDGGSDGLDFYRRFAENAGALLSEKGTMLLEIGHLQGDSVQRIFAREGWQMSRTVQDQNGKDRVIIVRR